MKYTIFKETISTKRIEKYKINNNAKNIDFDKYLFNLRLSEAFYIPLHFLELCLRNKIDSVLSKEFGDSWIYQEDFKRSYNVDNLEKVQRKFENNPRKNYYDKNTLISNLSFGFWATLLYKDYEGLLWKDSEIFNQIFSYGKPRDFYKTRVNLLSLKNFRNDIFHYKCILDFKSKKENPFILYQLAYALINDLAGKEFKDLASNDKIFYKTFFEGFNKGYIKK